MQIERARLLRSGMSDFGASQLVAAVDRDFAVVSDAPGEGGFVTAVYRRERGRWTSFAASSPPI
ncbi:MAG TPA: hypothetical protein VGN14_03605 [Candidatus Elarobacter sp.]|jgi:hypothetical protein